MKKYEFGNNRKNEEMEIEAKKRKIEELNRKAK